MLPYSQKQPEDLCATQPYLNEELRSNFKALLSLYSFVRSAWTASPARRLVLRLLKLTLHLFSWLLAAVVVVNKFVAASHR